MPLVAIEQNAPAPKEIDIDKWTRIPTAIISDEMNRFQAMDAGFIMFGETVCSVAGLAVTVRTMESDNLAIHKAVSVAPENAILVIEAGGGGRNAVWGGILHRAAELRKIRAVIIDGYVRDTADLRKSSVLCLARGVVPSGPQKAWSGEINGTISVGGCSVKSGDIIVVDCDGVAVVPSDSHEEVFSGCERRMEVEKKIMKRLNAGETTVEIFGLNN